MRRTGQLLGLYSGRGWTIGWKACEDGGFLQRPYLRCSACQGSLLNIMRFTVVSKIGVRQDSTIRSANREMSPSTIPSCPGDHTLIGTTIKRAAQLSGPRCCLSSPSFIFHFLSSPLSFQPLVLFPLCLRLLLSQSVLPAVIKVFAAPRSFHASTCSTSMFNTLDLLPTSWRPPPPSPFHPPSPSHPLSIINNLYSLGVYHLHLSRRPTAPRPAPSSTDLLPSGLSHALVAAPRRRRRQPMLPCRIPSSPSDHLPTRMSPGASSRVIFDSGTLV
jgi:hypothetical protein